jgi:hypothetical protein
VSHSAKSKAEPLSYGPRRVPGARLMAGPGDYTRLLRGYGAIAGRAARTRAILVLPAAFRQVTSLPLMSTADSGTIGRPRALFPSRLWIVK